MIRLAPFAAFSDTIESAGSPGEVGLPKQTGNIVECVPNFSEGRDRARVARIQSAIESVAGVRVLDLHMDPDHHRSVITFVADEQAVLEAAVRGVVEAATLIDLNHHTGIAFNIRIDSPEHRFGL